MNVEQLKNRDYYLIVDKSGSMTETDTPNGQSRWKAVQETTMALATKLNEYDPDGITVVPFASSFKTYENTTPAKVTDLFKEHEPLGSTVLAPPLKWCMENYMTAKKANKAKANGAIVLVVTDGQPQDGPAVSKAIIDFTKQLETGDAEFGISFLQVGKDAEASRYLKSLDDDLEKQGAKFDIVDTKTFEEVEALGLTETLVAALTD